MDGAALYQRVSAVTFSSDATRAPLAESKAFMVKSREWFAPNAVGRYIRVQTLERLPVPIVGASS
jgi:hypothetical protein